MSIQKRERIAVMTSGGDCQGMNAALRAVVRRSISADIDIYGIFEGYRGFVDGNIRQLDWDYVSGFLQQGGTHLGTARCLDYKNDISVRRKCVYNLLALQINKLIVIGGDGSLTGAMVLSKEWKVHVDHLCDEGLLPQFYKLKYEKLMLVGLGGSIDNDIPGTGITIGVDSALHQIVNSIDTISTTASSHKRTFIIEVMGRSCGYLALRSAIATGADFLFIPENPCDSNWRDSLADSLNSSSKRFTVIVVAEGAVNINGEKISCNDIKNSLSERGLDSRITILGHIQRGGKPSGYDRLISTILGVLSVRVVTSSPVNPVYVGIDGKRVTVSNLEDTIELCNQLSECMKKCEWERLLTLRGNLFSRSLDVFNVLSSPKPSVPTNYRYGFLLVGAPSPGMNAALRAAVRFSLAKGNQAIGFYNGVEGLASGDGCLLDWDVVSKWSSSGGAFLGTNRTVPSQTGYDDIAQTLSKYKIDGLIVIGGWESYVTVESLQEKSKIYPQFRIPIITVPAVVSNNCPGTDFSIGCDTALNQIVDAMDIISMSDSNQIHRLYITEVMGGKCGYLALISAIAAGANIAYLPEKSPVFEDILRDINMVHKKSQYSKHTIIINNEKSSESYTTETLFDLFQGESNGDYTCKRVVLGHIQQGFHPSPQDRFNATILISYAIDFMQEKCDNIESWYGCVGLVDDRPLFTEMKELQKNMDYAHRRPRSQWWYEQLLPIMLFLKEREVEIVDPPVMTAREYQNEIIPTTELSFAMEE
eukprot:TRINITY_DN7906_c0_g1_i1.p1 TRINITY_DN7906_c0_g1~~TRINITY_DN7906_c0_g1_i1.p1  ORF type:complete len:760 (-),score=143.45 TRINITY_DN7906_c0_g1_i1:4-2283(-)